MSQIFVDPGFSERPDALFCSKKCVSDGGHNLDDPDSNIFPIDHERFLSQKDIMGWGDACSVCGKPLGE